MTRRLLAALLLALTTACSAPSNWSTVQADVLFGSFWEGFVEIAERQGYPAHPDTDRGKRTYLSNWREAPAPFGMSRRTRLHGRFQRPVDDSPGWQLQFYVERQTVTDMRPGFEPEEDDWTGDGQDGVREDVFLGQLRLRFGQDLGIGPAYRDRERG